MTPENNTPKPENEPPIIPLPENPTMGKLLETLLKSPLSLVEHLRDSKRSSSILLFAALVSAAIFGLLLGTYSGGTQLWSAPLKLTSGLFISALICLPSLYIFSALGGCEMSLPHLCRVFMAALAVIGLLLVSFTPVVWIFSQSTNTIGVVGVIVISVWIISLGFGLTLLGKMLLSGAMNRKTHFRLWCFIFTLVTLQMSTALRPIIGTSDDLLPTEKRFFLQHWLLSAVEDQETSYEETISR